MNNVRIKVLGNLSLSPVLLVDGKKAKIKKNEFGNNICQVQTENEKIEVCLYKYHEFSGKFWLFTQTFFFIISLFGIFNTRFSKKINSLECKFIFDVKDNLDITIQLNEYKEGEKAVNITSELPFIEEENIYLKDEQVQKRLKIFKYVKLALWIFLAIGSIIFIFLK